MLRHGVYRYMKRTSQLSENHVKSSCHSTPPTSPSKIVESTYSSSRDPAIIHDVNRSNLRESHYRFGVKLVMKVGLLIMTIVLIRSNWLKSENIQHNLLRKIQGNLYKRNVFENNGYGKIPHLVSEVTIQAIKQLYSGESKIPIELVEEILRHSKDLLAALPSVIDIDIPEKKSQSLGASFGKNSHKEKNSHMTVVGDIHGQFYTLMHIFATNGFPTPATPYIFSGDMIDSGDHSFKLLLSLMMIKLSCPTCIHFIRGNHEVKSFFSKRVEKEIKNMYGAPSGLNNDLIEIINQLFLDTVRELPIAAVLHGTKCRVLVLHGGIATNDLTLEHIMNIRRGRDPEYDSLFENLLWADPHNDQGMKQGERGQLFGPNVTQAFLERNDLCLMIRGHTYEKTGYSIEHDNKVITLYSSPKYRHKGATLQINSDIDTKIHNHQPPYPEIIDQQWLSFLNFDLKDE